MPKRVTLREIARKTGYHFTTVSLALRHHRSIPEKTRAKIQEMADRMGYQPDPALSALVAYRHSKRQPVYASTLIWLSNYDDDYHWRKIPLYVDYFEGAREQAKTQGYLLETFNLKADGMTLRRAQQILESRGITGLLIPPMREAHSSIDLDWSPFSAVSFGYTLEQPRLHTVSSNHFRMMVDLIEELHQRDYKRLGLVMLDNSTERVENKWIAAFLGESFIHHDVYPITPLLLNKWDPVRFDRWFDQNQPDVLISGVRQIPDLLPHLSERGIRFPEDIGFADYNLSDEDESIAGMKQNAHRVGKAAVNLLTSLIHQNEKGVPLDSPINMLIDGYWFDGPTVRPRIPGESKPVVSKVS